MNRACFGLVAFVGLGMLLVQSIGCGSNKETGTAGGGHSSSSSSSSTDDAGVGIHDFTTAQEIGMNDPTSGKLSDPTTPDFYRFTGKAGDRLEIVVRAQTLASATASANPTVINTNVLLLDANKKLIAFNDDGWPWASTDSRLFVMLPADGDYYLAVSDCNAVFVSGCETPVGITTLNYEVTILSTAAGDTFAGPNEDGTTAKAGSINYTQGSKQGEYMISLVDGLFATAGATDVFSFTPPANTTYDTTGRPRAEFWFQWPEKSGDGSTSPVKVWVTDSTGTKILAAIDQSQLVDPTHHTGGEFDLSVPFTPGQKYYLFVQSTATTSSPTTDYYFALHEIGSVYFGTKETEGATATGFNDTTATAQALTTPSGAIPGTFYVDGNLPTGDIDWFSFAPSPGAMGVGVYCDVALAGSGLRGFQVDIFGEDGTTKLGTLGPEATPATDLLQTLQDIAFTTTPAKVFAKITAASQDATDTGTDYRCTFIATAN